MSNWLEHDVKHVWHPYTQMQTAPAPLPVVKAEGVYLYTEDGRKILDGTSSWWVNIHGHSHPVLNKAIQDQVEQLSQIIFANFTHEPASMLAKNLAERCQLPHVFFSDNGSTSVEVGLKMAYQYWRNLGEHKRTLFVAFNNSYHGDTFGAMAVSNVAVFAREFNDILFAVKHVPLPTESNEAFDIFLRQHAFNVAAVIIEPMVQAAGGMLFHDKETLKRIQTLCKRHHIPLIADEVFTAFGRTGKFLACEHAGITPDILCLSKGLTAGYLPLGVTLAKPHIYKAYLSEDRNKTFFHGHSYTGNALSCAVANASLKLFDENQCLQRIQELQNIFQQRLQRFNLKTRSIGGIAVIELPSQGGYLDNQGQIVAEKCLQQGLLIRPLGHVIYFIPPYCITDEQVHFAFDVLEKSIT